MAKVGHPSKYDPKYCQEIIDFFDYTPTKNTKPRFLTNFANKIGVCKDTLNKWSERHEEFLCALKKARNLQNNAVLIGGLTNVYNPSVAIFTLKNIAGWRDKQELEHSGEVKGGTQIVVLRGENKEKNDRKVLKSL